ncbi:MAG TPA: cell wall-binding repeat-containing protein [Baekduia sp.]|uniref:cell wall-binding repeat-containing protein n=1 Tax=Baekduia sp. TaxID=2600305 RepID=UPI002BF57585|nr:cell wall-binding repeat-containing protein [Baekduia sp.]HMJ35226.1 cell wall-binding repeat-containing protein [Baekduia sp.]
MRAPRSTAAALLALAVVAAGCGRGADSTTTKAKQPEIGAKGTETTAAADLGFPVFATKNTTRVGGADPVADAAAVARAVYSGSSRVTRPRAVVLADDRDWRVGLAASVLMSSPIRAPLLYAHGPDELPAATKSALAALAPTGSKQAGGAQVVRVGDVPELNGMRTTDLRGADAPAIARAIDAFQAAARGTTSDRVVVVPADSPEYAMPAAAWAAKAGDPILFTNKDDVPRDTRAAIAAHQQPKIYVLGPESVVSNKALAQLRRLGTVSRISGPSPAASSVAFARFVDGNFGWGVVDPGHGFVFASTKRPGDAAAAAPLSASGTYGPLLVSDDPAALPPALQGYLLDVQPGYTRDPVRGVYNHGWIVGDEGALSVDSQSRIDALLEIVPVNERASPSPKP